MIKSKKPVATDLRSLKSRETLRAALLQELDQRAFQDITVRDLTANARIGYATFFRHYDNLDALLEDLATEQIDKVIGAVLPVMESRDTLAACRMLCEFIEEHRRVWAILLTGGAAQAMRQELMSLSGAYAATQTALKSWLPDDLGVALSVSCAIELLVWWLRQSEPLTAAELAELLNEIIHTRLLASGRIGVRG